ncbi:hypothetical protein JCM8097_001325 [Rhodosporidiobolus ruineniae]
MAATHTRSPLSLVVLSLLAVSQAASTLASSVSSDAGVVELTSQVDLANDGLFDLNSSEQFLAYEDAADLLPQPEPADYELLNEDEVAAVFERSVDGNEAGRSWHRRGLNTGHHFSFDKRATVKCSTTADCTSGGFKPSTNGHAFCNRTAGTCTTKCNSGYSMSGSTCVKEGSSTSTKTVPCSSTADCTSGGFTPSTNGHAYCDRTAKTCITKCNSNYELSGESCVKAGSAATATTTKVANTKTTVSLVATSSSGLSKAWTGTTTIVEAGTTGVGAMQVTLVDDENIVIYDKAENNALKAKDGGSAYGSVYNIATKKVRALNLKTNSFCAGGGWLSNGTLVSVGGNPQQTYIQDTAGNGLAAIRLFTPCSDNNCDVYENPSRVRMTSARWYPSTVRLTDGSVLIAGGMIAGGYNNAESTDNPTMEYYPPKGTGLQFYSKFLHDALNSNLFPVMYTLPNGYIFIAANQLAMLYDHETNTERRIKSFPNGVTITYPGSAASALLPLTVENNWTPSVVFCGGTTANLDIDPSKLSATYQASKQCSRMEVTSAGIKKGWEVENMPFSRVMGDFVIMPDGNLVLVNGAGTGIAGYGNVKDEVGASNAGSPRKEPLLYNPNAASGSRFSRPFPLAKYERLYHSSATLLPDGSIWIGGSNPNDGVSTTTYATRYQVEILKPPYLSQTRPTYSGLPSKILYGKSYTLTVSVPSGTKKVQAALIDVGYSTHGVHMSNRYVELETSLSGKKLTIKGPKTTGIYPPGPGWLYILADGVPSKGLKVMVGPGNSPPVSQSAIKNMLAKTKGA